MTDEPTTIGGNRARGARRKLTSLNTEDVPVSDIGIGDLVLHPNRREPVTILERTVEEHYITLTAEGLIWQIKNDVLVKRVLPEGTE